MARNMGDAKKAHTSNDSAVGSTDLIPPHALEPEQSLASTIANWLILPFQR